MVTFTYCYSVRPEWCRDHGKLPLERAEFSPLGFARWDSPERNEFRAPMFPLSLQGENEPDDPA